MLKSSRLVFLSILDAVLAWTFAVKQSQQVNVAEPVATLTQEDETSFRILMGLTDTQPTRWDGSLTVRPGRVDRIEPWRLDGDDAMQGTSAWKVATREFTLQNSVRHAFQIEPSLMAANGVVVTLSGLSPDSVVHFRTAQGEFQFRPADLTYGSAAKFLGGRVMVDRVPPSGQVVPPPGDHDYPAAASDKEGNVWVAYVEFSPNRKFLGTRLLTAAPIKDFQALAEPTGGDQIFLLHYAKGVWGQPMAVSEPHGDLYKPTVAVDGEGRVWVFWSANQEGNFDLYARSFKQGQGSEIIRLTSDRGADLTPVATTDAQGRGWVAWQAFRQGRAEIHALRQEGSGYSAEMVMGLGFADVD